MVKKIYYYKYCILVYIVLDILLYFRVYFTVFIMKCNNLSDH